MAVAIMATVVIAAAPTGDSSQSWGQRLEGTLTWTQAQRETRFREMQRLFPADVVASGGVARPLPEGKPLTPRWSDPAMTVGTYMRKYHLAGVMVLQDGKIRLQRYALGFGPGRRWTSFSVAKSFTSALLGVAVQQGYVHSLDDPVTKYLPQLRRSAYTGVTIRQLLTMTSGVRWSEGYTDPKSDVAQMYLGGCHDNQPRVLAYLEKLPREWPPGTHWNYNTAEIDLLGILVARATHRPLATWLSETIWKPYGMGSDAYWLKDPCGDVDLGGNGIEATLADYARMGQLMLDNGRIHDHSIFAQSWLDGALHRQEHTDNPERGYGYLWWTGKHGSFAAIGIFGQLVYVDPGRRLVIAQVGAWPAADSDAEVAAREAFVAAVERAAGTPEAALKPDARGARSP